MLQTISEYTRLPINSGTSTQMWIPANINQGWVTKLDIPDDGIPVFEFKPLDEIRIELEGSGWSAEDAQSFITGLSELPEYADQSNDILSREE